MNVLNDTVNDMNASPHTMPHTNVIHYLTTSVLVPSATDLFFIITFCKDFENLFTIGTEMMAPLKYGSWFFN